MQVNELFKQSNTILLDGGMGTMLQAAGLKLGARPEELNITDPYQIIPPIVVMSLLMLSFNLVADGLREALDPKMKSM